MYSPHIVRYCHCLLFIFVPHWPAHREARSDSPQQRSPVSCSFTLTQDGDPGRDLAVSSEREREVGAAPCQCGPSVTEKRSSSRHQHSAVCQNCRTENRAEDTGIFTPALASSSRLRQESQPEDSDRSQCRDQSKHKHQRHRSQSLPGEFTQVAVRLLESYIHILKLSVLWKTPRCSSY